MNAATDDITRQAIAWAALTIRQTGGMLHAADHGWDVELTDGSWRTAQSASELCDIASDMRKAATNTAR